MTQNLDIANRSLQFVGTRTNMTASEFANQTSNEAIQTNLIMFKLRDELNRMAPWNFARKTANLTYITSIPGTPENSGSGSPLWQPGVPAPPWAYEYQYPVDCLRMRFIMPQYTASAGGVPIYPVGTTTGSTMVGWTGPALKFTIANDTFFGVTAAAPAAAGLNYAIGDVITLAQPSYTFIQNGQSYTMPVGAPAQLTVTGIGGGGAITSVTPINLILGETDSSQPPVGGSYFSIPTNPVAQGSTTGVGTGATFNLTMQSAATPQRVVLCNQESAIGVYNAQITDPNVMDFTFQDAWVAILGARLAKQLTGNTGKANSLIAEANGLIAQARKDDGNEDITVNDVTPDFLRIRGNYGGPNWEFSPNMSFDWGSFYSPY